MSATEANALLRTNAASGMVSFRIHNTAEATDQIVRVNVNGKELSRPVLPVVFEDSWGMGVQIKDLLIPK